MEKDKLLAESQLKGFRERLHNISTQVEEDAGIAAVIRFYSNPENVKAIKRSDLWSELIKNDGTPLAFRLEGQLNLVCQSKRIQSCIASSSVENIDGFCLVSGGKSEISRTHASINIPGGTNPKIVSFNRPSFESFGKSQSYNSPIGSRASFEYTTALNYLLRSNSKTKFQLVDAYYVCWSEKASTFESTFTSIFLDSRDNPDQTAQAVKSLFSTIHNGAYQESDRNSQFYVLGLAPNSARIVVRFWKVGTIAEFSKKIAQWFDDLDIEGRNHYGYPHLKKLLSATALQHKDDNITPNLPAEVMRSILNGWRLPETLMQSVLRRVKAEQGNVNYLRACSIKAYLNRKYRTSTFKQQELTVSLNKDEIRIGYCLGRLFAVLEKLQSDAQPGINATIRDRYYSSASSTPKSVFGTLMRLSTHHLKKMENPAWRVNAEKRIGEIMELVPEFPSHLNMENQGLFAIGYYHQKQDFYSKKSKLGDEI